MPNIHPPCGVILLKNHGPTLFFLSLLQNIICPDLISFIILNIGVWDAVSLKNVHGEVSF